MSNRDELGPDPNEGSTDPMIPEHWQLGEDLQDRVRAAGYDPETVEGLAVDIHGLLQSSDRIRDEIVPTMLAGGGLSENLRKLQSEIAHLRWHTLAADGYL